MGITDTEEVMESHNTPKCIIVPPSLTVCCLDQDIRQTLSLACDWLFDTTPFHENLTVCTKTGDFFVNRGRLITGFVWNSCQICF